MSQRRVSAPDCAEPCSTAASVVPAGPPADGGASQASTRATLGKSCVGRHPAAQSGPQRGPTARRTCGWKRDRAEVSGVACKRAANVHRAYGVAPAAKRWSLLVRLRMWLHVSCLHPRPTRVAQLGRLRCARSERGRVRGCNAPEGLQERRRGCSRQIGCPLARRDDFVQRAAVAADMNETEGGDRGEENEGDTSCVSAIVSSRHPVPRELKRART